MLETSVLGLGQDLCLISALGGAMTTSTYFSHIVFDLNRASLRGQFLSLPKMLTKILDFLYSAITLVSGVRELSLRDGLSSKKVFLTRKVFLSKKLILQAFATSRDTEGLICDRGIRTEGSRKFVHGKTRRSLRGLIQNQCRVSCGTIACSDVTEGNERQKPASRRAKE
ncbi:hypothetical protein YC2023_050793 [Brassica napus]